MILISSEKNFKSSRLAEVFCVDVDHCCVEHCVLSLDDWIITIESQVQAVCL